jgi:hypothetical protein
MAKAQLTEAEIKLLRAKRDEIVKDQVRTLLRMAYGMKDDPQALRTLLSEYRFPENKSFKTDAIIGAIEYMQNNPQRFSPEIKEQFNDLLLEKKVGTVKTRPLEKIGEKDTSITPGSFVHKIPKNATDTNTLKQSRTWVYKGDANDPGEIVFEILGTNLFNYLMGDNSPKIRLHKDSKGNVLVMSKFIENFKTLADMDEDIEELSSKAKGFARFFAATALFSDYDFHKRNIGFRRNDNGELEWARIDNGRALSYFVDNSYRRRRLYELKEAQTAEGMEDNMIKTGYPEELFEGFDFSCELSQAVNEIDEKKLRKIIKFSMRHLQEAYGENFLDNDKVKEEFRFRMHIDKSISLTPQFVEDEIVAHVNRLQAELKEFARYRFTEALYIAGMETNSIDSNGVVNYDRIITHLKQENNLPKDLSFFMQSAIENEDLEGVKYLHNLNNSMQYPKIKIDNCSSLEFALKLEKNDLAMKMMQAGFVLNEGKDIEPNKVNDAIQNIIDQRSGRNIVKEILEGKVPEARRRQIML